MYLQQQSKFMFKFTQIISKIFTYYSPDNSIIRTSLKLYVPGLSKLHCIYNWLEYSADLQMSFCYVCRNFAIKESLGHMKKFVDSGFNRWKKLPESLKKHDMFEYHIQCLEAYRMYKISSHNVHEKISQHHSTQNQERRTVLRQWRKVNLKNLVLMMLN